MMKKFSFINLTNVDDEVKKLIKIFAFILILFGVFYSLTLFLTKPKELPKEEQEIEILYDEILLSQIFNQKKDVYYVLVLFDGDYYGNVYKQYFEKFRGRDDYIDYYKVNINDGFNYKFISEESKLDSKNVSSLKFKESTLLKIENKRIVSSFEGFEKIINHLEQLVKQEDN